jgi:hypothetical protein
MALVVENGTGLSTAESYVSADDADTYLVARGAPATWEAASDVKRQQALRVATEWLDARMMYRWLGQVVSASQALAWPRAGVYDINDVYVASDAVPTAVERATAEAAAAFIEDASSLQPGNADAGDVEVETVKLGSVTHTRELRSSSGAPQVIATVDSILRKLARGPNEVVRE